MSDYQAESFAPQKHKPGKVQALAIMTLIDGILNILGPIAAAIAVSLGLIGTIVGTLGVGAVFCLCVPLLALVWIYSLVLGILEIIYAAKLLPEPPKAQKLAKYMAIMQIINIISGNTLSLVTGILALVFANDLEVASYFTGAAPEQ